MASRDYGEGKWMTINDLLRASYLAKDSHVTRPLHRMRSPRAHMYIDHIALLFYFHINHQRRKTSGAMTIGLKSITLQEGREA